MDAYDAVVVGGGIAGLSVAAEVAPHMHVAVLEAEVQPAYHATSRSAAILAQNYGDALIRALTAWSEPALAGEERDLLRPRGLVRVARPARRAHLEAMFREMVRDTPLIWLEAEDVEARVPILGKGWAGCGFANDAAADIDVAGLVQVFVRRIKAAGGAILTGAGVSGLARREGRWEVSCARERRVTAPVLVDAAGSWADEIAQRAGAAPLGLVPMRRSAVSFDVPPGTDLATLPMIVDADERFYLKPEGAALMASPCDETPDVPGDSRPEELDIAICLDRIGDAFGIEVRRPRATWSGLRTFAPDRAPVCGWDPEVPGFYWLAGQGGSGVQTAPALARLAADDLLGRGGAARTEIPGVSRAAFDPARFVTARQREERQRQGVRQ